MQDHVYTHINTYIHTRTHTCTNTHIHTNTQTHTNTRTYTYNTQTYVIYYVSHVKVVLNKFFVEPIVSESIVVETKRCQKLDCKLDWNRNSIKMYLYFITKKEIQKYNEK